MSEPRTDTFPSPVPPRTDTWYYPPDLADDMKDVHYISADVKAQLLTSAWEAVRSGTPHYTNWERYLAFVRIYIVAFFCDFSGQAVDLLASDRILGYSVSALLDILFEGMPQSVRENMQREVRCALFFQAEKSSNRRNGELFRRYANSLAQSPRQWFRMRSCDGMARFSMMAALACNDILDVFFSEEQWEVLGEIVWTMYDAVAFYKHRSEGEVCNTFAYMPEMRIKSFWLCREVLWALDTAWARETSLIPVLNNLRLLGGTVHMMMRRYTFVEDQLCLGVPETEETVSHARGNFKLWYRITASELKAISGEGIQHYKDVLDRREELLFPGLAAILETADDQRCDTCLYPDSYATEAPIHCFGGVQLCDICKPLWRDFLESLPERTAKAFPELNRPNGDGSAKGSSG
ncbi:BcABA3 [Mycena galopus ATCC 62051]|nr:BcABA3 [Mycena galopus ATCC 62051]